MKILITGGCGFVGSNLAVYLKEKFKKAKIYTLDSLIRKGSRQNQKRLKRLKIQNFNIDISKNNRLKKIKKFDLIIDCCAEPAINASYKDPDRVFNTNLIGTFNILKKCVKDKSNLIFLSSSRVYSITKLREILKKSKIYKPLNIKKTINESFDTSEPSSLYGFTKLASEKLIKEIFYKRNLKYIINRFGVIAGPWQFGKEDQGFASLWVAKHFFNRKLKYIGFGGNGHQIRDLIHIDDVCNIISLQIRKLKKVHNDTFNIGGGIKNAISLKNLTIKCEKLTKNKISFKKIANTSIYDIPYFVTDNRKIYKRYKWKPQKSIDEILNDIYIWLKKEKNLKDYF